MNSKKITMLLAAIICIIFLASCDNKNNLKTDTSPSDTTAYEQTQSERTSSNQIEESKSGVSSETSDSKDNIELVKEKRVSDLLTHKTVPNLTLTLNELFNKDRFDEVTWIDNKDSVRLCVKRTNTDNQIIFNFTIVGSEVDFPSVSTMLQTNDGGVHPVEWSMDNIDDGLIKLLIADGFVIDLNGTYKVSN